MSTEVEEAIRLLKAFAGKACGLSDFEARFVDEQALIHGAQQRRQESRRVIEGIEQSRAFKNELWAMLPDDGKLTALIEDGKAPDAFAEPECV